MSQQDRDRISRLYRSGKLAAELSTVGMGADEQTFDVFVQLHNEGQIDLLSIVHEPGFKALSGIPFFELQNFYCYAIPRLDGSVESMLSVVDALVDKGGADLAAGRPGTAFREWCRSDLSRSYEVLSKALAQNQAAVKFLPGALNAHGLIDEARKLLASKRTDLRRAGITTLSGMNYESPASAQDSLEAIKSVVDASELEDEKGHALLAALDIAEKVGKPNSRSLQSIAKAVCRDSTPTIRRYCARSLMFHARSIGTKTLEQLLAALEDVQRDEQATLYDLGIALSELLRTSQFDECISFLTKVMSAEGNTLELSDFEGLEHQLLHIPDDRVGNLFASWLGLGNHTLLDGLNSAINKSGEGERPVNIPPTALGLGGDHLLFICRKAIGYLFFHPVVAGSVLVSVLRSCDKATATQVQELLFDPMLVNYSGLLRQYLHNLDRTDAARSRVKAVLRKSDKYLEDLRSVDEIKELQPSARERRIVALREREQMAGAHREAEKQSVLFGLASRSVILHGRRSVTYVIRPGGTREPVEVDLHPFSLEIEMPRMQAVDPNGLEYLLSVFRSEPAPK